MLYHIMFTVYIAYLDLPTMQTVCQPWRVFEMKFRRTSCTVGRSRSCISASSPLNESLHLSGHRPLYLPIPRPHFYLTLREAAGSAGFELRGTLRKRGTSCSIPRACWARWRSPPWCRTSKKHGGFGSDWVHSDALKGSCLSAKVN